MAGSIIWAAQLLTAKQLSPVELTQGCLSRIERLDGKLNSFIRVTAESALAAAKTAEVEIQRGEYRGPLHGVPIALKDLADVAGLPTTAGSNLYKDRIAAEDAEVVRRLKAAGAVLLGKLNMQEFAYGGSSVVSAFGPTRNPWSPDHSVGGSSGGSAAAVAAQFCYGALGSDTGGSIRQPAAYCGIVGLKPTYGRVSTRGVVPLAWTLDHVGPMTRTVADAAVMLQAIAGHDPADPASADVPVPDYTAALRQDPKLLRLGVPRAYFFEEIDGGIGSALEAAIDVLRSLCASVRDITIPASNDRTLVRAEAYAFHRENVERSPELYQPETLRRIRTGAEISAAEYIAHRREVDALRHSPAELFRDVDLLITPTTAIPPPRIDDLLADMENLRKQEIVMLRNTRPFNALGLPTISIPCGFTRGGLPIGMQITGAPWREADVLRLAHAYERATEWHTRRPAL
ncbi:MAG TPA: amidase [Terriglobales bacterium]|nr:amidase [Terriglobales bacterium]